MDLFESFESQPINIVRQDGMVEDYGKIFSEDCANAYYKSLYSKVEWKNDEAIIYGKKIITKRKVAWYGDESYDYTYSNSTKFALPWIEELISLKAIVENKTSEVFNSCLLNLYHSGEEGMSWHSDAEKDLIKNGAIASLSLGAERKFVLKHKITKESKSLFLQNGSLLVMKGCTQDNWMHCLPKTKKVISPRINLTFRTINKLNY